MSTGPVTPLSPAQFADAESPDKNYLHKTAVGLDDFVNVLAGGDPDETVSSRMARWATEPQFAGWKHDVGAAVCAALNKLNADHGAKAEAADLGRADAVVTIEQATPTVQAEEAGQ